MGIATEGDCCVSVVVVDEFESPSVPFGADTSALIELASSFRGLSGPASSDDSVGLA